MVGAGLGMFGFLLDYSFKFDAGRGAGEGQAHRSGWGWGWASFVSCLVVAVVLMLSVELVRTHKSGCCEGLI